MTDKAYVTRVAKQAGLLIEATRNITPAEITVECRPGHCWPDDVHERVFECETLADCWAMVREDIDWLAEHQAPCAKETCPGWRHGCEYWGTTTATLSPEN